MNTGNREIERKAREALIRREGEGERYYFTWRGAAVEVVYYDTGSWLRGYADKRTGEFIVTFYGHA